jgi:hypothetical protein
MKLTQLERSKTELKRVSYAINKFLGFLIIYFNSVKVSRGRFEKSRDQHAILKVDPGARLSKTGRRVHFYGIQGLFYKMGSAKRYHASRVVGLSSHGAD